MYPDASAGNGVYTSVWMNGWIAITNIDQSSCSLLLSADPYPKCS